MSKRRVAGDTLQQARAAYDRNAWQEAYDLFAAAAATGGLTAGEDFERLAEAAFWTGRVEAHVAAWERAHAAASDAGLPAADRRSQRLAPVFPVPDQRSRLTRPRRRL